MRIPKNPTVLISAIALALGIILGLAALFQSGWRVGRGGLARITRGKACVTAPLAASVLYVDDTQAKTSRANEQKLCESLAEGEHMLLLGAPGTSPWFKKVVIDGTTQTRSYHAFTIAQDFPHVTLDPGTEKYIVAQNALVTFLVPTQAAPLRSADGALAVWYDPTTRELVSEWRGDETALPVGFCEGGACASTITLLSNVTKPPRALAFAPGRDDVLLIAIGKGVYALEITAAPERNFQSIYFGESPRFVRSNTDTATLYIGDGPKIFSITLHNAGL
ncbi:MAG: hypothetical protein Q8R39_03875 [bacterium]|nr:hypothetical protein [bacterium]MDZ4285269.1 hypothetical protein [Patescibacteria group bacterium]